MTEMMRKMNNRVVVHMYMCLGVVAAHTIANQLAEIHSRSSICLKLYGSYLIRLTSYFVAQETHQLPYA